MRGCQPARQCGRVGGQVGWRGEKLGKDRVVLGEGELKGSHEHQPLDSQDHFSGKVFPVLSRSSVPLRCGPKATVLPGCPGTPGPRPCGP